MPHAYLILGAGRQGLSAAYDLARFGDPTSIVLLDANAAHAKKGAARINRLTRSNRCRSGQLDVRNHAGLVEAMKKADVALSAVPYFYNEMISRAAVAGRASLCDLGGHPGTVRAQLRLKSKALKAGISLVPDCGLAPGAASIFGAYLLERFEARRAELGKPTEILIYCGGLPAQPQPPLGYQLCFSMEGLLNEYEGHATYLRNGKITDVKALTEVETLDLPKPFGRCEAFVTTGGTSLGPWNVKGRVENYEYKTVRYPGHVQQIRLLQELGFFSDRPLQFQDNAIVPRHALKAVLTHCLAPLSGPDLVVLRVVCRGKKGKQRNEISMSLYDRLDPQTGLTAMERTTGFSAAIVMIMLANGQIEAGAGTADSVVPPALFLKEMRKRGFKISERLRRC